MLYNSYHGINFIGTSMSSTQRKVKVVANCLKLGSGNGKGGAKEVIGYCAANRMVNSNTTNKVTNMLTGDCSKRRDCVGGYCSGTAIDSRTTDNKGTNNVTKQGMNINKFVRGYCTCKTIDTAGKNMNNVLKRVSGDYSVTVGGDTT